MPNWNDLTLELDAWHMDDRIASLWWRDDDVWQVTARLERLLDLSDTTKTPLSLAVIPAKAQSKLRKILARHSLVSIIQHGYCHANHSADGEKKSEFGPNRDQNAMLDELGQGKSLLAKFDNVFAVLAPPWNRIDTGLLASLPSIGIKAISRYGATSALPQVPGLKDVNTHIDPVLWRSGRCFCGVSECLRMVIAHLSARRQGIVDQAEPTGLLTHHLDHDENLWSFLNDFMRYTHTHPAVRWLDARELWQ